MKKKTVVFLLVVAVFAAFWYALRDADTEWPKHTESEQSVSYTEQDTVTASKKGSPYKFYYEKLGDTEKRAYNAILEEIYDMPEQIAVPKISGEELDRVFSALLYDNPDLFFIGRKCAVETRLWHTYFSVDYIVDKSELADMKAKLETECEAFEKTLTNSADEWLTELQIHDRIIEKCEYIDPNEGLIYSSAYGALVDGNAACEGYSKAAKLLLDRAGIENALVSGESDNGEQSGAHMWNVVNIGGKFYHLDCTWDDPVSDDEVGLVMYAYFNLSDKMISETHSNFSYDFGCNSDEENYYVKTNTYFESYSRSCESRITEIIVASVNEGRYRIQFRFADKNVYNEAISQLIGEGRIYDVLINLSERTDILIGTDSIGYYENASQNVLTLVIKGD